MSRVPRSDLASHADVWDEGVRYALGPDVHPAVLAATLRLNPYRAADTHDYADEEGL